MAKKSPAEAEIKRLERLSIDELCETADRDLEFLLMSIRAIHGKLNSTRIDRVKIQETMREIAGRYSVKISNAMMDDCVREQ